MKRPCQHADTDPQPDSCRPCNLYVTRDDYNRMWGGVGVSVEVKSNYAPPPVADPRNIKCRFIGKENGNRRVCEGCRGHVELKLYDCHHDNHEETALRDCLVCPDYEPAKTEAEQNVDAMADSLESSAPGPWPPGWRGDPVVIGAHTVMLNRVASKKHDYPGSGVGRGIVIAAGGPKYFTCAWACLHVLRAIGCTLPVELWHLGDVEMDPFMKRLVAPLGAVCVDARKLPQPRILCGWELKPFAIRHSRFREVLFLDADNVPARDPTFLFDDPAYRARGAVFWPDLPPSDRPDWVPPTVWKNCAMEPRGEIRAFESGQILVDKERCWQELALTAHVNDHSDYWYGQVYGDKDTFLIGWHKAAHAARREVAYAMPFRPAGWISNGVAGAIIQHDFNGNVLFQHRCRPYPDKWSLLPGGNTHLPGFSHENICIAALENLARRWRKSTWHNAEPSEAEKAFATNIPGKYLYRRSIDLTPRSLELADDGRVGAGAAECERRWSVFEVDGEMRLALCREDRLTCLLRFQEGRWVGRWEESERAEVELWDGMNG